MEKSYEDTNGEGSTKTAFHLNLWTCFEETRRSWQALAADFDKFGEKERLNVKVSSHLDFA